MLNYGGECGESVERECGVCGECLLLLVIGGHVAGVNIWSSYGEVVDVGWVVLDVDDVADGEGRY